MSSWSDFWDIAWNGRNIAKGDFTTGPSQIFEDFHKKEEVIKGKGFTMNYKLWFALLRQEEARQRTSSSRL
jgi:hypothetical protein